MLRIATWNINHAGPARHGPIVQAVAGIAADVIVLTEFAGNGSALRPMLAEVGLREWVDSDPPGSQNGVAIASKLPLVRRLDRDPCDPWAGMLAVDVGGMVVIGVYGPGSESHSGGHKIKGVWWDGILTLAETWRHEPAVIIGDFNNGERLVDERHETFAHSDKFLALAEHGFRDGWRERQPPGAPGWSWWGTVNPYRLDHVFVSKQLTVCSAEYLTRAGGIRLAAFPDDVETDKPASDHAALVAEVEPLTHR